MTVYLKATYFTIHHPLRKAAKHLDAAHTSHADSESPSCLAWKKDQLRIFNTLLVLQGRVGANIGIAIGDYTAITIGIQLP